MKHLYDSGCYCFDCCDAEERLQARIQKEKDQSRKNQRDMKERFVGYETSLQLVEVEKTRR